MPYKFKVGDRVKVLAPVGCFSHKWRGRVGTVSGYKRLYEDDKYPWHVELKVNGAGRGVSFNARELEAAPMKTQKKRGK